MSIKDRANNLISNLKIELDNVVIPAYKTKKETGDKEFAAWVSRAILTFAQYLPSRLGELHKITMEKRNEINFIPAHLTFMNTWGQNLQLFLQTVLQALSNTELDGEFLKLEETQVFRKSDFSLSDTQKSVLRILVTLKSEGALKEPISIFPYGLRIRTISGYALNLGNAITDFKLYDLTLIAEENLLSHMAGSDGIHHFYIKQSTIDAVKSNFLKNDKVLTLSNTQRLGSPYGFRPSDWVFVEEQKRMLNSLIVVFGHQFKSKLYVSTELQNNLRERLNNAVEKFNVEFPNQPIALDFRILGGGYGEHLFNDIARNIMSSDIAIFETSEINPNVMLEMGVALTWGASVLPIKKHDQPRPPSDISGQTWADYKDNGLFIDPNFDKRLLDLVIREIADKRGPNLLPK